MPHVWFHPTEMLVKHKFDPKILAGFLLVNFGGLIPAIVCIDAMVVMRVVPT
jgi:hypothetical protein